MEKLKRLLNQELKLKGRFDEEFGPNELLENAVFLIVLIQFVTILVFIEASIFIISLGIFVALIALVFSIICVIYYFNQKHKLEETQLEN